MRTIDELTERIFSLEKTPLSTYQQYINSSVIREVQKYFGDIDLLKCILCDFETLIAFERGIA
jgi:starvation-inducible DNA-binding protein